MAHQKVNVDQAQPGRLPAGTANCPELGGRCTEQGSHFDHLGELAEVGAPHLPNSESLLDVRLAEFAPAPGDTTEPVISVSWAGGNGTELTPAEAIEFAADLEVFSLRLMTLARQLQHITDQA